MDYMHNYTSSTNQLQLLNACRLYHQITFLSDITNIAGDKILQGATTGQKQDILFKPNPNPGIPDLSNRSSISNYT